ncbi:lysophospholipid acyltransferase family protein [Chondromyces apiculatus]|uniref:Phospholipid/glycerol acyltransferase n=1 Tax=Chondromyces apiculatus DSM 436 TaxID=1192034 RepID=A0A017T360_9BACT|nr:lysophospholipid acyltransferase family protein [Chondromyces apiculatus]EYF03679.1 Phospholipid/glycerol acyltransferase [Chondromyces apiculatus DSM 436]
MSEHEQRDGANEEETERRESVASEEGTAPDDLVASDDLEEDISTAVAPIGPTEPSPGTLELSHDGPPSGPGDEAAASSRGSRMPTSPASPEELERQILELEARLDQMMREGRGASAQPEGGARKEGGASPVQPTSATSPHGAHGSSSTSGTASAGDVGSTSGSTSAPGRSPRSEPPRSGEPGAAGTAEAPADAPEILSSEYYNQRWGRDGMRRRAEEVDEYGFDPRYEERYRPLFDFLYRRYFRVEVEGIGRIPNEGRCLVVGNHSGGPIPYDGLMLRAAVQREHPRQRELRWLAEDFVYYLPFAGTMMNRLGAVRACQENAERLLSAGKLVAVFPEGVKGISKLYRDRYKLQRFGRGGFIRLSLRTRTPLVPCAIVGAEEANPLLHRVEHLTRLLGVPYVPITPIFPALGPLGLVPAPTKWKICFGEKIYFDEYGPDAADDDMLVSRLSERVRASIQALVDRTLAGRRSVWFG